MDSAILVDPAIHLLRLGAGERESEQYRGNEYCTHGISPLNWD
jgi:hypothetical protein